MFVTSSKMGEKLYNIRREPFLGRMLFILLNANWLRVYFVISLVIWGCTGYAYNVNAKLPADDLKKKDFHPLAIILAPITLPFVSAGFVSLLIIKAIVYAIFLVIFTAALIVFRKPFILEWLKKIATKIGNVLLEINTFLIRIFYNPKIDFPQ